jgi:PIN domain nuclease of toxin-antitoxin system
MSRVYVIALLGEMQIKQQLGKITLRISLKGVLEQQQSVNGIQIISILERHVLALGNLPNAHKDPFDRILIAQAFEEHAVLVTADHLFRVYPKKGWVGDFGGGHSPPRDFRIGSR